MTAHPDAIEYLAELNYRASFEAVLSQRSQMIERLENSELAHRQPDIREMAMDPRRDRLGCPHEL
jgi:hypothetical protein